MWEIGMKLCQKGCSDPIRMGPTPPDGVGHFWDPFFTRLRPIISHFGLKRGHFGPPKGVILTQNHRGEPLGPLQKGVSGTPLLEGPEGPDPSGWIGMYNALFDTFWSLLKCPFFDHFFSAKMKTWKKWHFLTSFLAKFSGVFWPLFWKSKNPKKGVKKGVRILAPLPKRAKEKKSPKSEKNVIFVKKVLRRL